VIAYTAHKIAQYIGGTMKKILYKSLRRPFTPLGISLIGIMSGMAITVTRLLTIFPFPSVRFDPGGPAIIMLAGMIMGPIGGALVGGLSDLIGFFFWNPTGYPWNPIVFIGQIAYGFVAGLITMRWWGEDNSFVKEAQTVIAIIVGEISGFLIITWGLSTLGYGQFVALLVARSMFLPFYLIWYSIICIAIMQPLSSVLPWRRYESKA